MEIDNDTIYYEGINNTNTQNTVSVSKPTNITELLLEVQTTIRDSGKKPLAALVSVLRKYKFWPALQVKKFYSNDNLLLLHNTYKRIDVEHFQKLYDECRSIVLDFSVPEGYHVVVTYANSIPERMTYMQYEQSMQYTDYCEESFEGTVVTMYYYMNKWHFGTSSCPTIDSSRYFHPTKTHGTMFNEAIAKILNITNLPTNDDESDALRQQFAEVFDKTKSYAFILVHHDNKHVIDYTSAIGSNYAKLVHIITRDRTSLVDESINTTAQQKYREYGLVYPTVFSSSTEALQYLRNVNQYGFIVTRADGTRIKVSSDAIIRQEEFDLGHPNKWFNMLSVYIRNRQDFKIVDYQKEFCPQLEMPKDSQGKDVIPTYIIHTVICTMRDILYNMYINTTLYNSKVKKFRMNKEVDAMYAPIIRFHLAQLRNIQVTYHTNKTLTPKVIYHYLCHHQTLKNLRVLIKYFATVWFNVPQFQTIAKVPPRTIESFKILDTMLSAKIENEIPIPASA